MPKETPKYRCADIRIAGMHCESCELLLERKLKTIPGIKKAEIDHRTGIATITADVKNLPSAELIETVVEKAGYSLASSKSTTGHKSWIEIGAALVIIFAMWKLLQTFDLVSLAPSTAGVMTLGGVFLIGLVAGTSSCLAVTGGLLLSMAAKYNETQQSHSLAQKLRPLLSFNAGRLLSYFLLGGLVGLLGQSIALSTKVTGLLNIAIAILMIGLAFSILHIIPHGLGLRLPKRFSRSIVSLTDSRHPLAPLLLGALTFFLPCGFTQSLQLAALSSGSPLQGAMIMGVFALGTLPSLLGLSLIASLARGRASHLFLRLSGALVLLLAIFNLSSGMTLLGIDTPWIISGIFGRQQVMSQLPPMENGVQLLSMKVTPMSYEPQNLTVRAGIPVRWTIDGSEAAGCTSVLVVPELAISRALNPGTNIVEFTAPKRGHLAFSCSMGMVHGSITVL